MIHTLKQLDHSVEGVTGMMLEAAAYELVSIRPWIVPDRMREVFTIP